MAKRILVLTRVQTGEAGYRMKNVLDPICESHPAWIKGVDCNGYAKVHKSFFGTTADSLCHCTGRSTRRKKAPGHWMWYVFPQLRGLGQSTSAWYYGIENLDEARIYLAHPLLGRRLREITQAILDLPETDIMKIFAWPDNMKFHSCMTLFAQVSEDDLFVQTLDKFFDDRENDLTLNLLRQKEKTCNQFSTTSKAKGGMTNGPESELPGGCAG